LKEHDANQDGKIDLDEYMMWHFGHLLEPKDPIDTKIASIMEHLSKHRDHRQGATGT
jgi:hypothetical protein